MEIGPYGKLTWQEMLGPQPATDPNATQAQGAAASPQADAEQQLESPSVGAREGEAGGIVNVFA